jgi:hypothetical protein
MNGFDKDNRNKIFDSLGNRNLIVHTQYIFDESVKSQYKNLDLRFSLKDHYKMHYANLFDNSSRYDSHIGSKNLKNFICCFNGTEHLSRQFITSAFEKFGWFNTDYSTKNFTTFKDRVDGNISSFFEDPEEARFYGKFILTENDEFYSNEYSFEYSRYNHSHNVNVLADRIKESFIQVVSEVMATSYYPYVSEKFLYPIIHKTLWVSYAQPNWHSHVEQYYGFKKYEKIFDYKFDSINNPVIRLVELLTMISKFEKLSISDWHDLYLMEQDTLEYNYDWYKSKKYLDKLKEYA